MSHFAAQPLSRGEVGAKVDPGENSAQGRLFCSRREALEGALRSRHNFRCDVKVKLLSFEDRIYYRCPCSTPDLVRTRIAGVRCRFAYFPSPVGVTRIIGVVVACADPR